MGDNADSHELLSVVAAVHHERVGETLNDWALGLAETLGSITSSRVGDVDWSADLDVIAVESYVSCRSYNSYCCPSISQYSSPQNVSFASRLSKPPEILMAQMFRIGMGAILR